jgi:hypothetical protein
VPLKQTNEVLSKFHEHTEESLTPIVTLLLKSRSQAFPSSVVAALLRFFSLIVMYQCLGTSLLSPLIQWLEGVVGSFDAYTKGEKVLIQMEALPILREIGKCIPFSFDQCLLKVRGLRDKTLKIKHSNRIHNESYLCCCLLLFQPLIFIFQKLLNSDSTIVSSDALTALEVFSSNAPSSHAHWILFHCVQTDDQKERFRHRLQCKLYNANSDNKFLQDKVSCQLERARNTIM